MNKDFWGRVRTAFASARGTSWGLKGGGLLVYALLAEHWLELSFWMAAALGLAVLFVWARLLGSVRWLGVAGVAVLHLMLYLAPFGQLRMLWSWVWIWGLVAWGVLQPERDKPRPGSSSSRSPWMHVAAVLLAIPLLAVLFALQGGELGGDEPHYLMMAQSIWEDGDLNLENQVESGAFRTYVARDHISPHTVPVEGHARSFHLPGTALLPGLLWPLQNVLFGGGPVPAFWFRLLASLWGMVLALQLWFVLRRFFPESGWAGVWRIWSLMTLSLPFWGHSAHLYPEIPAACLLLAAFDRIAREALPHVSFGFWAVLALWFHVKYAPLVVVLLVWGSWRTLQRPGWVSARSLKLLATRGGLALLPLLGLLAYVQGLYGTWNPMNVYPREAYLQTPHLLRLKVFLSFFLDQRDGLIWSFPLLFLLFARKRTVSDRALWLLLGAYVSAHAWTTVRGGHAPLGRPLMAVFWVLVLLLASRWQGGGTGMAGWERALAWTGLWWGGLVLLVPVWLYQPVVSSTVHGSADWLAHLWRGADRFFPSFLTRAPLLSGPNLFWLAIMLTPLLARLKVVHLTSLYRRSLKRLIPGSRNLYPLKTAGVLLVPLLLWPGHPESGDWHLLSGSHVRALSSSRRLRVCAGGGWQVDLARQRYVLLFPVSWQHGAGLRLKVSSLRGSGSLGLPGGEVLADGRGCVDLPWSRMRLWNSGRRRYRVLELEGRPGSGEGFQSLILEASSYRNETEPRERSLSGP